MEIYEGSNTIDMECIRIHMAIYRSSPWNALGFLWNGARCNPCGMHLDPYKIYGKSVRNANGNLREKEMHYNELGTEGNL